MKQNLIRITLIVVAFTAGYFVYDQYDKLQELNRSDMQQDQQTTTDVPENWEQFTTSTYSFSRPPESMIDTERGRTRVRFIGPETEEDSEITDGILFYVETKAIPDDSDLAEFAQMEYEQQTQSQESIQEPSKTTIEDRSAYEFVVRTQLGTESNRVVMESEDDSTAFVISYTVSDPNNAGYDKMVEKMIKSLELN